MDWVADFTLYRKIFNIHTKVKQTRAVNKCINIYSQGTKRNGKM